MHTLLKTEFVVTEALLLSTNSYLNLMDFQPSRYHHLYMNRYYRQYIYHPYTTNKRIDQQPTYLPPPQLHH